MLYLSNKNEVSLEKFYRFDVNNWDELKRRISYRLINKKIFNAQEDTENIIYENCMDLCKVYIVTELSQDRKNIISYMLKNEDLEYFNKTRDELYMQVESNYMKDRYKRIRTMKEEALAHETLYPLMKKDYDNISLNGSNMLIEDSEGGIDNILTVTNKYNVFGASYMVDKYTLREIHRRMKSDFYILPMSTHQLMCISQKYVRKNKDIYEAEDDLLDMLYKINSDNKNAEDILSYKIYQYISDDGEILFPIKQRL